MYNSLTWGALVYYYCILLLTTCRTNLLPDTSVFRDADHIIFTLIKSVRALSQTLMLIKFESSVVEFYGRKGGMSVVLLTILQ